MNYSMLLLVLAYEVILIGGVGAFLAWRQSKAGSEKDGFALAGRDLPVPAVATTMALTVLGSVHILGVFEMSWFLGASAAWFGIAHVILLTIVCKGTGVWVRKLGVTTVPEILERLYGTAMRLMVSCVMAGMMFGAMTLESQGLGILFSAMTDWDIKTGAIVGGGLGIAYVILAGMKEVGWLNVINAIIMYVALILAVVWIGFALPGDGYNTVADYYLEAGEPHMISLFGTAEIMVTFAIATTIAVVFSQATNQMLLQVAMAAKNESTIRRSLWIAAPVNGMFAVFAVVLGLAAKSVAEFNELGPKVAAPEMLVQLLPGWLSGLLLASFIAVILSTFAMVALASSTLFSRDIYQALYRPQASEREITLVTRVCIVLMGSAAIAVAAYLPPILAAVNWLLAWLVPVFWLVVFGLFWKSSRRVGVIALTTAWVLNMAWSFTDLPAMLGLAQMPNSYVTLIVTVAILVVGNLLIKGQPGLLRGTVDATAAMAPPRAAAN